MSKQSQISNPQSAFRRGGLRTKIIAWSFIPTAIILIVVALVNFYAYQQVTEKLVIERDQELIRLSAAQLASELSTFTELLAAEARAAGNYTAHPAVQRLILERASDRLVVFDGGVLILDTFGKVVAVKPERPEILGQGWSDRSYFRQMAHTSKPVFSNIVLDGPEAAEGIAIAVPITGDQGQFLGAIVGMFRLRTTAVSAFYGGIVKLRLAEGGTTYLVDGNGQVIYHSDIERIGEDFSEQAVVQQVLNGQVGAIRTRNVDGQDIVAGFAPVPGTPWSLVTEERWATLTSDSRGYQQFLLLLLILGVVVPALIVTIGVRRIVHPLEALIEAARKVARGNFGQTITARTGDEVEALARQFNLMSAQLQESYTHLEQRVADRTKELAILNAIAVLVNESLDLYKTLDRILDETLGLLNLEVGEICLLDEESDELVIRTERGLSLDFVRMANRRKVFEVLPECSISSGEPVIEEDVFANPDLQLAHQEGLRTMAIFPLRAKERLLGTLCLATRLGPRSFTRNERELLRSVSDQAAVAIENARLYTETSRRVDEIETLFAVGQAITSRLDPDAVLQMIADEARRLTSSRVAFVFLLDGDTLRLSVLSSEEVSDVSVGYRMPLANSLTSLALDSGQPLRISDARQDPRANPDLRQRFEIRSLMIVPLISGSEPIGSISVINRVSGTFGRNDERVLTVLASGAVIGLENARLYHEEQERRHEAEQRRRVAEGLRDILTVLNSNRPLTEILDYIVAQANRLLGTDAVAIYRLQEVDEVLKIQAARGLPDDYVAKMVIPVGQGAVGQAALLRQPVAIANLTTQDVADYFGPELAQQPHLLSYLGRRCHALLAVPLIVRDEVYGGIVLYYSEPRQFSDEEIELAVSFGNQAALAIENARLFAQAEQAAMLEERQRLARDLHDSVTQSLYGLTMYAEAAARLLSAGEVNLATDHLRELRSTAHEALQEMRLLLFELRPPILEEEGLTAALQIRLEAVERRSGLEITLNVEGDDCCLPSKVEDGLYRIALEALNNTLKHAQAKGVKVHLRKEPERVTLEIADDGIGFDPATVRAKGGMGLQGMEERAAMLGGRLTVRSKPEEGTVVRVEVEDWKNSREVGPI